MKLSGKDLSVGIVTGFAPALSGFVAKPDSWYAGLRKPAFNPPGWVFAPVWTGLYLSIGLAYAEYLATQTRRSKRAGHVLYAVQLALNASWPLTFFLAKRPKLAFGNIVLLLAAAAATEREFSKTSRKAGMLLWPYLGWLAFAALLNEEIVRRNEAVS